MKTTMRNSIILILVFLICGASDITFRVMLPAPVDVPKHIKSIAIIDRSVPDKNILNIIEGGLTGEGIGQDKLGTQITIDGLTDILKSSVRFIVFRTNEAMISQDIISAAFADPIPWSKIAEICAKYKTDAVIALEKYDSDFIITGGQGGEPGKGFSAHGVASVKAGFRLYDLANKEIIDEYLFTYNMNWQGGGGSILDAVGTVMEKNKAIRQASYDAGYQYGQRLSPSWYSVTRYYFRKSKHDPDFAEGARMMEANDWDRAIAALTLALENGHRKTRGRAAHNLAVVYEILGDLEQAREYARTAWGKYKQKKSRDYGYILNNRIKEQEVLKQQMGE